jgi:hypothetical protein
MSERTRSRRVWAYPDDVHHDRELGHEPIEFPMQFYVASS